MQAQAGWYPDPGGQAGMFRYWDGQQWSHELSSTPMAPPPHREPPRAPASPSVQPRKPGSTGKIVLFSVLGVAVAVLLYFLVSAGLRSLTQLGDDPLTPPGKNDKCRSAKAIATPKPRPVDGRVYGGNLSYPRLTSPWSPPLPETRVPFAIAATTQSVMVEPEYSPSSSWVAAVTIGSLVAGDGFFAPKEGAEVVAECVMGNFYGNNALQRKDISSQATTVDGRPAWQLEMHLAFDIKGLKTKGETAIIAIVDTGGSSSSLYYASIPDSRPELLVQAKALVSQLKVST